MTTDEAKERAVACLVKIDWASKKQAESWARPVKGLQGRLLYWLMHKRRFRFPGQEGYLALVDVDTKAGTCNVWERYKGRRFDSIWSDRKPPVPSRKNKMPDTKTPYSDHFDNLVALVTHLAMTDFKSRRVRPMSRVLGIQENEVRTVLDTFPAYFRKSRRTDKAGEHYYTIHLRYARRSVGNRKTGGKGGTNQVQKRNDPLRPEELSTLLELISKMVAHEKESSRLIADHLNQVNRQFWPAVIAILAAGIAAWGTIMAALPKK